ncbi:hypothetical protein CALCODRAFT_511452 [Calocera cornea HHB12733]|uniref:DNA2/NAM7 helicase-like C-terminal domain-containing protein n=1 Tax=Calocera cornea HHB12733 TaxID=1353952 RepID=A0A165DRY5_9BASI|nr:hypothetical protein CALCODRAFT_511452 [Calocera cornea HHB12733]
MVGDEQQLAPTVRSEKSRELGLDRSLFHRLASQYPESCAPLNAQYRMNDAILLLLNNLFYDNALTTASPDVGTRLYTSALPSAVPTVLERTSQSRSGWLDAVLSPTAHPLQSNIEALLAVEALRAFLSLGLPLADIAILTPYKIQAANILAQEGVPRSATVLTIDSSQGQEREVIIATLVYDQAVYPGAGNTVFGDSRRINVLLSRARSKLVLIGDMPTFQSLPTTNVLMHLLSSYDNIIAAV